MEPTLLDGDVVMVDRSNDLLMLRRSLKFLQKGSLKQANTTRFKALIACNPTGTVDLVKLFCVRSVIYSNVPQMSKSRSDGCWYNSPSFSVLPKNSV